MILTNNITNQFWVAGSLEDVIVELRLKSIDRYARHRVRSEIVIHTDHITKIHPSIELGNLMIDIGNIENKADIINKNEQVSNTPTQIRDTSACDDISTARPTGENISSFSLYLDICSNIVMISFSFTIYKENFFLKMGNWKETTVYDELVINSKCWFLSIFYIIIHKLCSKQSIHQLCANREILTNYVRNIQFTNYVQIEKGSQIMFEAFNSHITI